MHNNTDDDNERCFASRRCFSAPVSSAGLQVSAGQPQEETLKGGVGGDRHMKGGDLERWNGGGLKK